MDLASAARAVNAANVASPGAKGGAKGVDGMATMVAVWHFPQGLPLHRGLIDLEDEIRSPEYSRNSIHNRVPGAPPKFPAPHCTVGWGGATKCLSGAGWGPISCPPVGSLFQGPAFYRAPFWGPALLRECFSFYFLFPLLFRRKRLLLVFDIG